MMVTTIWKTRQPCPWMGIKRRLFAPNVVFLTTGARRQQQCRNIVSSKESLTTTLHLLDKVREHAAAVDKIAMSGWKRPQRHDDDDDDDIVTFAQLLAKCRVVANVLTPRAATTDSSFVAHLCVPGWEYTASLLGTWMAGSTSVPLAISHATPELEHVLEDTRPHTLLLGTDSPPNRERFLDAVRNVGMQNRLICLQDLDFRDDNDNNDNNDNNMDSSLFRGDWERPATVLYTSGTTGKPKGVLSTHRNVHHQVTDLVNAWCWDSSDVMLHTLPLHHVHGLINGLCCALYAGARVDFTPFDAPALWKKWATSHGSRRPTLFMGVPTMYAKLLEAGEDVEDWMVRKAVQETLRPMRLQVSGSAALPVPIMKRWKERTGHTLLERFGMTEFAMALSNPYHAKEARHAGHVGMPLPSVQVRIVRDDNNDDNDILVESNATETNVHASQPPLVGRLQVKGPTVFSSYLNRPDATASAFTKDGYFDTGDIAEFNQELQSFRILGRASVDILKVGGYVFLCTSIIFLL